MTYSLFDANGITTSGAGEWSTIAMVYGRDTVLEVGKKYAAVVKAPSAQFDFSYLVWRLNNAGAFPGGNCETSTNAGATWITSSAWDLTFVIWGNPAEPPEHTYPINVQITSPIEVIYTEPVMVSVIVLTNGSNPQVTYNIWNHLAVDWIYEERQDYTEPFELEDLEDGTYILNVWAVNDEGYHDEDATYFHVNYETFVRRSPSPSPVILDAPTIKLIIALGVCLGMGAIGFGMGKGKDPTPGLFMVVLGVVLTWVIGWMPAWVFIFSIVLLAVFLAMKFSHVWTGGR